MGWKARWIWTPGLSGKRNSWALFRGVFTVGAKRPRNACLRVTAGHFCHVYLNGRLVGRGPDRCYHPRKVFHTYDVTAMLRRGRNVLAVRCHYLDERPEGLMDRHAQGPAGLIAQLDLDGRPVVWTDGTWRCMEDPAYSSDTQPVSRHREWREEYHAAREVRGWRSPRFDDAAWPRAEVVAPAEGGPWERLVAKDTPELAVEVMPPVNVYVTNRGGPGDFEYEHYRAYNLLTTDLARDLGPLHVRNERQERQEILFDMGRVVAGYPEIRIADSLGGKIEIYYGDSLDMTHWDTIHLGSGPLTWTPFTLRGGRYFRLDVSGARNPVAIERVRWVRRNYPVRWRGDFACSDPRLDAIWRLCALTAETCGLEHFVDCVGREQVLWMMDFRFQALQHYYHFGDTALARKCLRQFALLQLRNGHVLAYGPSCAPKAMLESGVGDKRPYDWLGFNFYLVLAALENYGYTGDRELLTEMYAVCKRCLAYYADAESDGFATCGEVSGHAFVEWGYEGYGGEPGALYGFTQALYCGALAAYASMCRILGKTAAGARVMRKARDIEDRFYKTFVDPRTGRVADRVVSGKRVIVPTTQTHAGVLLFMERIPAAVKAACLDVLVGRRAAPCKTGVGTALVVEALFRHGHGDAAVALLRDYWGAILDAGLPQVPEFYDMRQTRGTDCRWSTAYSRCHAYASLAGVILQQRVLGARVEGRLVRLSPFFGSLDHASGVVPTVGGDVRVSWRRAGRGFRVTAGAPAGVDVRFEPLDPAEKVAFRQVVRG